MIYESHYAEPPPIPDQNAVLHYLYHPNQKEWQDYTLYIEANSGKKISFFEFRKRVEDGITALGGDVSHGGLGLGDNDIVGIVSENSIVCVLFIFRITYPNLKTLY
jgi:hypothetical protein